ncbi:MAG: hypothetical protein R6U03_10950, partial [Gillisia sp.]
NHFIYHSNGNRPTWMKSGLEHGLPEGAFKTDLRIIEIDPRTPEEKLKAKIDGYYREIEKHQQEIERLEKQINTLLSG